MRKITIGVVALLVGCKGGGDAAPAASAEVAPAAVSAVGSAVASASATSASAKAPGGLSVAAHAREEMRFAKVRGAEVLEAAGAVLLVENGRVVQRPGFTKGIPKSARPTIEGDYPDALVARFDDEDKNATRTFLLVKDTWGETQLLRGSSEHLLGLAPFADHALLAAIEMEGGKDIRFALAAGKSPGVIPAPAKGDGEACPVKLSPNIDVRLAGLPSGHVFISGDACDGGKPIVERIDPKQVHGKVYELPLPAPDTSVRVEALAVRAADDAWAAGTAGKDPWGPYLAHFDGTEWKLEATPFKGGIREMTVTDDGTRFVHELAKEGGHVWRQVKGGTWEAIERPDHGAITGASFAARSATDYEVALGSGDGFFLLTTHPVDKTIELPVSTLMSDTLKTNQRFYLTDACESPYAHLATLGASGGAVPKAFPQLKDFAGDADVAGASFVVEDDGASLYLGAIAKTPEQARKIAAKFKEKNPKAQPNSFCHEPIVKQKIEL